MRALTWLASTSASNDPAPAPLSLPVLTAPARAPASTREALAAATSMRAKWLALLPSHSAASSLASTPTTSEPPALPPLPLLPAKAPPPSMTRARS